MCAPPLPGWGRSERNQYFGDTRDLFKYDLAMHCMEHAGLSRLNFVPMLTPDDGSADGRHVDILLVINIRGGEIMERSEEADGLVLSSG